MGKLRGAQYPAICCILDQLQFPDDLQGQSHVECTAMAQLGSDQDMREWEQDLSSPEMGAIGMQDVFVQRKQESSRNCDSGKTPKLYSSSAWGAATLLIVKNYPSLTLEGQKLKAAPSG